MTKVAPAIFLAIIVPVMLLVLFFFVTMRFENVRDISTPFECGFDPSSSARIPFSLRFFMLAVVFLIFDVEVALLFPLPYIPFMSVGVVGSLYLIFFLMILLAGLFHEWKEGSLNWV